MSFLLDTNVCSAYMRGNGRVFNRFIQHSGGLYLSTVCLAELYAWVLRAAAPPGRLATLQQMLAGVSVLDVDSAVALKYGEVRAGLLDQGITIATADMLIAATALVHDLTVVTHNVAHFAPVPGLRVEDWIAP